MPPPRRILFVCVGNICRSPTAEAVFRDQALKAGWGEMFSAASAGVTGHHAGEASDARTRRQAALRGYRMDTMVARQLEAEDFARYDLLLAMEAPVLDVMRRLQRQSGHLAAETALFLDYLPGHEGQDVPDPYYGGEDGFEVVLDLVEEGSTALLRDLLRRQGVLGCGC